MIFVNTTPLHKQIVTGRTICETLSCFFQAMSINSALAGGSFPWTNALHLANGDLDANSYVSNSALAAVARAVAKKKKGGGAGDGRVLPGVFGEVSGECGTETQIWTRF